MCGICGIVESGSTRPPSAGLIERMCAILAHRGPDDAGMYLAPGVGLGHRRLAVIDLETGRQPITNEDGTIHIVYNGEIYNYRELRAELIDLGHRFATETDTEMIVHAYEEFGEQCVSRFNGMFAFALWDEIRKVLWLARDRLGVKPLYYCDTGASFVFASEIKAILAHPDISAGVDPIAVPELLLCTTLLESRTMFRKVRSVEPGTCITVEDGLARRRRYWSLEREAFRHRGDSLEDCCERVRGMLDDAVRMQVVSDVPLGTLLSGGLDSSLVSALATRHVPGRLMTFSMDYASNEGVLRGGSDRAHARLVSEAWQTNHTDIVLRPEEYFEVLECSCWHVEKPVDLTAPSLYLLYRRVKPGATVVMSGEGADELFGGYYFFVDGLHDVLPTEFPWAPGLEVVSSLVEPGLAARAQVVERTRATLDADLAQLDTDDSLNRVLYLFVKRYLVDMLERLDKTSMAWGVESRVPFLDHRLVEFAACMPAAYKARPGNEKIILKQVAEGMLPREVVARKKRPVPLPVDPMTILRKRRQAAELARSPGSIIRQYFDPVRVDDFLHKRGDYARVSDLVVYRTSQALLALDAWHHAFGLEG